MGGVLLLLDSFFGLQLVVGAMQEQLLDLGHQKRWVMEGMAVRRVEGPPCPHILPDLNALFLTLASINGMSPPLTSCPPCSLQHRPHPMLFLFSTYPAHTPPLPLKQTLRHPSHR